MNNPENLAAFRRLVERSRVNMESEGGLVVGAHQVNSTISDHFAVSSFKEDMKDLRGLFVKDADKIIIEKLDNKLFAIDKRLSLFSFVRTTNLLVSFDDLSLNCSVSHFESINVNKNCSIAFR